MEKRIGQKSRFLGFAGGHFVVSAIGVPIWFLAAGMGWSLSGVLAAGMMLLYLPAGAITAAILNWPRPATEEWGRAVLWSALAAWAWGFGGWGGLCLGVELGWEGLAYLCFQLLLATAFLATPSFLLMVGALGALEHLPTAWDPLWCGAIVLAGLLPALLFHLGALAGAALRRGGMSGSPERGGPHVP